jgi:hypothetical protein
MKEKGKLNPGNGKHWPICGPVGKVPAQAFWGAQGRGFNFPPGPPVLVPPVSGCSRESGERPRVMSQGLGLETRCHFGSIGPRKARPK